MSSKAFEAFKKETANHKLKIIKDDGTYRHIRFGNNSSAYAVNLTTFPYHLVITGDMGDYIFNRGNDMFDFFRASDIDAEDWGKRLVAEPQRSKHGKHWSESAFKNEVREYLKNNLDDPEELTEEEAKTQKEIIAKIESEIEDISHEEEANLWARDFDFNDFQFDGFYEYDCTEPTYHYLWICHAIIEVIKRYDEIKATEAAA